MSVRWTRGHIHRTLTHAHTHKHTYPNHLRSTDHCPVPPRVVCDSHLMGDRKVLLLLSLLAELLDDQFRPLQVKRTRLGGVTDVTTLDHDLLHQQAVLGAFLVVEVALGTAFLKARQEGIVLFEIGSEYNVDDRPPNLGPLIHFHRRKPVD